MNDSNIILIGMPGSGKSTCGVLAAKYLLKNFFDTDLLLQARENMLLQDIINNKGVPYFLKAEEEAVLSVEINAAVIATGGSVVYSEKAMRHLSNLGKIVFLNLNYDEMCSRISNLSTRGVVLQSGTSLADMYSERLPLYEKYADVTVNCSGNTVEETARKIVNAIE